MMWMEALESRLFLDSTLQAVITRNADPAAGYESYTVHFQASVATDKLISFEGAFTGTMNQVWVGGVVATPTMDNIPALSAANAALDSHLLLYSPNLIEANAPAEDRAADTGLGTYLGAAGGANMAIALRPETESLDLLFAQIVIPTGGSVHLLGDASTDGGVKVPIDVMVEDTALTPTMALNATPISLDENAAPVALAPTASLVEPSNAPAGATLKFSLGSATAGDQFQIIDQGTGAGQVGVSGANVTYQGTTVGTFTGGVNGADLTVTFNAAATSAAMQALLRDVTFTNTSTAPPLTERFVTVTYVGPTGRLLTGDPISVTIAAVNDPPVLTLPGSTSVVENTPVVFSDALGNPIGIADPDVGLGYMRVELTATNGALTLATTVGVTFVGGAGNNSSHIIFDATEATAVAALNGLTFTPAENYVGDAGIHVWVSDKGNYGSGTPLTDSGDIAVTLTANANPNTAPTAGNLNQNVDLSQATQFTLPIHDAESSLPHLTVNIITGPTNGTLQVLGSGVVKYTPNSLAVGADSFTYTVSDDGLGGAGGVMTSSQATVNLTLGRSAALDAKGKLTYLDSTGKLVNVSLTGGGTGTLYFDSAAKSDPVRIELTGTTTKSALKFTPVLKKTYTTIGDIVVSGPIGKITGGSCDLHGATVSIGATSDAKAAALTFHDVLNSSITSAMPLASLSVLDWRNVNGADLITAPRLDKLTSTGSAGFGADLAVSGKLGKATLAGNLSDVNWDVSALTNLNVAGTADTSVIRSDHSIGSLTFGAVSHTDVLAGIRPAGAQETLRHAAADGDFLDTLASIGKVTIKGIGKAPQAGAFFFQDSNFSAATIGTATVLYADLSTADGLWARGTTTPKPVKSVNYRDALGKWTYTSGVDSHGLVHLV